MTPPPAAGALGGRMGAMRTQCPGRISRSSGATTLQSSVPAYGQRGAKRQASGGASRSGGRPGIEVRRPCRIPSPSICGSAASSASVYGCSGESNRSNDVRLLDDLARVHDDDVVGGLGDDAHVVRDHDHRHVVLVAELVEQVEDAGLDGDVERGRRLVGDQQLRVAGERDRDHHALAHPARVAVRVVVEPGRGVRDADLFEQLDRALARLGRASCSGGGGASR